MADMTKDAMAAAHNHLKVAHDNLIKAQTWLDILGAGHNPVPGPLPKTQVFGLTSVWICLALFISLIVLAQFLRRRNFNVDSGCLISKCQPNMDNCLRSANENLSKISSIICETSDAMQSSRTLITHADWTSARFLQWKTIALCSMLLVVSVCAVYHIMVTPIFGITGVWICLALFISLIVLAQFLRRRNFNVDSGSLISKCQPNMDNCLRSANENLSKISSIICETSDAMQSSRTLITHADWTSARSLQWKTIALFSMLLVVSVCAVYHIMVTPIFGITGVWICLAPFISLIVLAQFLRRRNFNVDSGSLISKCQPNMDNCLRSANENLSKISSIICETSDAMQSSRTLITHADWTSAIFLQWKTITLCSMLLVVSVCAVYHIMVTPIFGITGVWTGLIIFMSLIGTAGLLRLPVFTGQRKPSELNKTDQSNKATASVEAADQQTLESAHPNNQEITSARDVLQPSSELMTPDPNKKETTSEEDVLQHPSELKQDPNNNETTSGGTAKKLLSSSKGIKSNVITKEYMTTEIKNSIKKLLSSKESLKLMKLDKINENKVEGIRDAIKAVRSIEESLTLLKSQKDNFGEHEKKIQDALKPAIDVVQSLEKIINNGF